MNQTYIDAFNNMTKSQGGTGTYVAGQGIVNPQKQASTSIPSEADTSLSYVPLSLSSKNGAKIANQTATEVSNALSEQQIAQQKASQKKQIRQTEEMPREVEEDLRSSMSPEERYLESLKKEYDRDLKTFLEPINNLSLAYSASTQALIDQLTSKYTQRSLEIQEMNKVSKGNVIQAGLRSGAARYAPEINQGMVTAEEMAGLKRLQDYDEQYLSALASANSALQEKQYSLAREKVNLIQESKRAFQEEVSAIMKAVQEKNDKIREQKIQASRENAIAGLVQQGLVNPAEIMDYLNYYDDGTETGGDFTSKEISEVLKNLLPEGLNDIIKSIAENPTLTPEQKQKGIKDVYASGGNIAQAYSIASPYLGKERTGTLGEYDFYVQQARAVGQTPMDFLSFKNYKGGVGGMDPEVEDKFRKEFLAREEVQNYMRSRSAYNRLNALAPQRTEAEYARIAQDDAALKGIIMQEAMMTNPAATKVLADGSVVASESLPGIVDQTYAKLTKDRGAAPVKVKQLVENADRYYQAAIKEVAPVEEEIKQLALKRGYEDISLPQIINQKEVIAQKAVEGENSAKSQVQTFVSSNPQYAPLVAEFMKASLPEFGNKPPTWLQAVEYLQVKGLIQ